MTKVSTVAASRNRTMMELTVAMKRGVLRRVRRKSTRGARKTRRKGRKKKGASINHFQMLFAFRYCSFGDLSLTTTLTCTMQQKGEEAKERQETQERQEAQEGRNKLIWHVLTRELKPVSSVC